MNIASRPSVLFLLAASALVGGCGARLLVPHPGSTPTDPADARAFPPLPPPDLPMIGFEPEAPLPPAYLDASRDPLAAFPLGPPVTLATRDADVAALLVALAEQAGISLVIDPAIQGRRVTVNFVDMPAREAIRVLLAAADLGIAPGPPVPPSEPTVFYALPVNVDVASAELIRRRFGVSAELAKWLVEQRLP